MKENSKVRSVKFFIVFIVAMIILSFVSRMMYTSRMPKVTTTSIKSQALTHTLQASGMLEAKNKKPVFVSENLRVADICVGKGDQVKEGDVLFRLDQGYLNERIANLEKEIASDRRNTSETFQSANGTPVFTESGLRVSDVCVKVGDTVQNGQVLMYLDNDYLNKVIWDLQNQINNNICQRDGYYESEDIHSAEAISNTIEEQQRKYNAYHSVAEAGGVIYSRSDGTVTSVISPGAVTEGSAVAVISNDVQMNYSVTAKQQNLDKLKSLAEQEGIIKSSMDGVVTDISITLGGLTSDTSALIISDVSEGLMFSAHISENDTKYISVGDSVSLSFRNGKKIVDNCIIKFIMKDDSEPTYRVETDLDDTDLSIGEIGMLKTSSLSDKTCETVPLAAVTMQSETNGYIYVVEENEGFLGVEYSVRKVQVRVEDKNDSFYGLAELGLDPQTKIVTNSSKKMSDGQRVRML